MTEKLFTGTLNHNQNKNFLDFKPLAIFCGCTAWFVSDLVGYPDDRFSHNEAHMSVIKLDLPPWRQEHQGLIDHTIYLAYRTNRNGF